MKAAERIAFYSQHFNLVEVETTFRFPPTTEVAHQWVDRTPDGFTFDIQAWSLLTGQPAMPQSLWPDLFDEVRPDRRDNPRLYSTHLSSEALDECWRRFIHSIRPLVAADRLGAIILRFPRWFVPRDRNRDQLEYVRSQLGNLPAAIQFSCPDWLVPEECESTLSLLDELGFAFVTVDAADGDPRGLGGVVATSSDLAVLRLIGRRSKDEDWWVPDRRSYRYTDTELASINTSLGHMSDCAKDTHVLVGTCWRDDAVTNAQKLKALL